MATQKALRNDIPWRKTLTLGPALKKASGVDAKSVIMLKNIRKLIDQFPGAIIKFEKPFKTSILLFASGKGG